MAETAQKTRSLKETMQVMGQDARAAAKVLATASADRKHAAFVSMAEALQRGQIQILAGNQLDVSAARTAGISAASHRAPGATSPATATVASPRDSTA